MMNIHCLALTLAVSIALLGTMSFAFAGNPGDYTITITKPTSGSDVTYNMPVTVDGTIDWSNAFPTPVYARFKISGSSGLNNTYYKINMNSGGKSGEFGGQTLNAATKGS